MKVLAVKVLDRELYLEKLMENLT